MMPTQLRVLALALASTACSSKSDTGEVADTRLVSEWGPYGVAIESHTIPSEGVDGDTGRSIPVMAWLPSSEALGSTALPALAGALGEEARTQALLDAAPAGCPPTEVPGSPQAAPAQGPWPLLVLSHCHECTAFNLATAAAFWASHGIVTVAPHHVGNTLYDGLDDAGLPLDTTTLSMRVRDLEGALDYAVSGQLGAAVDPTLVAVAGHSFGSVTAGMVYQSAPDIRGAVFIGAPAENPLLPGVSVDSFPGPSAWVLLEEDNSIATIGNDLLVSNFEAAPPPATLYTLADAGHWSVSDLVGLTDAFMPGCGEDTRMTDPGETFTYTDPTEARARMAEVGLTSLAPWLLPEVTLRATAWPDTTTTER